MQLQIVYGAHFVSTMYFVCKNVEKHFGIGLGAQMPLVRQFALSLQGGPQLLRVGQVAIVDLSGVIPSARPAA